MAYRLVVSPRAQREIAQVYDHYDEQLPGLGIQFLEVLGEEFEVISRSPHLYVEVHSKVRRALLQRFPYGVFYAVKDQMVSVLAVVHTFSQSAPLAQNKIDDRSRKLNPRAPAANPIFDRWPPGGLS